MYMVNVSIIILTDDEGTFQKMAKDHKGPFHFQTFIVKGMSVDLSVAVPHDKGYVSRGNSYIFLMDSKESRWSKMARNDEGTFSFLELVSLPHTPKGLSSIGRSRQCVVGRDPRAPANKNEIN